MTQEKFTGEDCFNLVDENSEESEDEDSDEENPYGQEDDMSEEIEEEHNHWHQQQTANRPSEYQQPGTASRQHHNE